MAYYPRIRNENDHLEHFGILGQKWGKRNGPPYPLSSRSEKEKEAARDNYGSPYASSKKGQHHTEAYSYKLQLSDSQKRALKIGIGVVAGTVIVGSAAYYISTHRSQVSAGSQKVTEILGLEQFSFNKVSSSMNVDDIRNCAKDINETHSTTNCGSAASAVLGNLQTGNNDFVALSEVPEHMRPVKADGSLGNGYDPEKLKDCYEGAEWVTKSGMNRRALSKSVEDELISYGDGSCGYLYPDNLVGQPHGHYFSWLVKDNKVVVVEGQVSDEGIVWNKNFYEDIGRVFDPNAEVHIMRVDGYSIVPGRESDLFKRRGE